MISFPRATFHLRRLGQMDILPGLHLDDLKTLADWAHLHPMDELSLDGKVWIKAHEFKELGMVWLILQEDSVVYGPTTVGTLKEFFVQGEIGPEQPLRHHGTGQASTVREVIGDDYVRRIQAAAEEAPSTPSALPLAQPLSSAERVRLLESSLQETQHRLAELTRNYRGAIQELMALRPAPSLASFAGFSH